ncbi:MAG: tocopherol cyclase family protein [Candidatus Methanospirareceae archaeon]
MHPECFQGSKSWRNYFEGWYYKLVDAAEENVLAVIPGISLGSTENDSHAFIQILNGTTGEYHYFTFTTDEFLPASRAFDLRIAANRFSDAVLRLDLAQAGHRITGELWFENVVPYPRRCFAPGIMGWASFVPFMQCKHGIVSMSHTIHGALTVDGEPTSFECGTGYIEKDWGRSFPRAYLWMQANHFTTRDTAFMLVLARIPWLHFTIPGFAAVLWHDDRYYHFATYTGARITRFEKGAHRVRVSIEDRRFKLDLEGVQGTVVTLKSPHAGRMTGRISESLAATLKLRLYAKRSTGDLLLLEDEGRHAGLEVMDGADELLHMLTRKRR